MSNGLFALTVLVKYLLGVYINPYLTVGIMAAGVLAAIGICVKGPIERAGSYVSDERHKKHKKVLGILILVDLILLGVLYGLQISFYQTVLMGFLLIKGLQRQSKKS